MIADPNPPCPHVKGTPEHAEWVYEHRAKHGLPVVMPHDNPDHVRGMAALTCKTHMSDDWAHASAVPISGNYHKVCGVCGVDKPAACYYRQRYGDGLTAECRACRAARNLAAYYRRKQEATDGAGRV